MARKPKPSPASLPPKNVLIASLACLTPQECAELDRLLAAEIWAPLPGPQSDAYDSPADVLLYGGAAGGGKTDLLLGLALIPISWRRVTRRCCNPCPNH